MFLKSWVNFIHKKTPLNHSAVLIWNLHLASTRSSGHSKITITPLLTSSDLQGRPRTGCDAATKEEHLGLLCALQVQDQGGDDDYDYEDEDDVVVVVIIMVEPLHALQGGIWGP